MCALFNSLPLSTPLRFPSSLFLHLTFSLPIIILLSLLVRLSFVTFELSSLSFSLSSRTLSLPIEHVLIHNNLWYDSIHRQSDNATGSTEEPDDTGACDNGLCHISEHIRFIILLFQSALDSSSVLSGGACNSQFAIRNLNRKLIFVYCRAGHLGPRCARSFRSSSMAMLPSLCSAWWALHSIGKDSNSNWANYCLDSRNSLNI